MNTSSTSDWKTWLWSQIISLEGQSFRTSGRGSRPGVEFTYTVSRTSKPGGRHYHGVSIGDYGNELWVINSNGIKRPRSISRSTVELGYK